MPLYYVALKENFMAKVKVKKEDELKKDELELEPDTAPDEPESEPDEEAPVAKATGKYYARKTKAGEEVIDPDGKVFRTYTKKIHPDPAEAAKGFAAKMNNKLAGAHQ